MSVENKPASDGQVVVVAKADPCLFTAFALLNTTGYNAESGWQFSEVRKAVRVKLAAKSQYWRSTLDNAGFLESIRRGGGAVVMDVIPLLSPPPNFALQADNAEYTTRWQNESRSSLTGIEQWLQQFYKEEDVESLWLKYLQFYEEAINELQQLSLQLKDLVAWFGEPSNTLTLEIVLLPNLLDAKGRGYSLSTLQRTWLFLGPIDDPSQAEGLAIHELLHRWIDVVAERKVQNGHDVDPMPQARAQFRIVAESYPELAIWIGETVVRAVATWLRPILQSSVQNSADESLTYYEQIGFIGIQDAYRHLKGESGRPLLDLIQESIDLVYRRVLMECSSIR